MHDTTFDYIRPTEAQFTKMVEVRREFKHLADYLDLELPEGDDKKHVIRVLREAAMWANVALTRLPDGTPRV